MRNNDDCKIYLKGSFLYVQKGSYFVVLKNEEMSFNGVVEALKRLVDGMYIDRSYAYLQRNQMIQVLKEKRKPPCYEPCFREIDKKDYCFRRECSNRLSLKQHLQQLN